MSRWLRTLFSRQTWCWHDHRIRERRADGQFMLVCEHCLHAVTPRIP